MFAVVIDRPYYPSVYIFETEAEAVAEAAAAVADYKSANDNPKHESHVYVMRVISDTPIGTDY
jgi:hypothetical protein